MKIGTRLTCALFLWVVPVLTAYTYWSVERSVRIYVDELRRSAHATTDSLAHDLEGDVQASEWDRVQEVLERASADGALSALFRKDGTLWYALPDFPRELAPVAGAKLLALESGEFEPLVRGRRWLCEFEPLRNRDHQIVGYMLLAEDWTGVSEDRRTRTIGSAIAAVAALVIIVTVIPVLVNRYVSRPLGELSDRVARFSSSEPSLGGSEVEHLTEEFVRLDEQLSRARSDLMERHQRELDLEHRLEHADRLATIGTLASGLAHEIGTPMGVIRGRAENLLRRTAEDSKAAKSLKIIIGQIDRVSRIVRTLLDYSRTREWKRVTCDVRTIVENALTLVENEAARRNVQLVAKLGDVPLNLECDPDQLQQVFVNLAINAFDAMDAAGGVLTVTAGAESNEHGPRLRLIFHDTGAGVAPEHQRRVFDPFFTTKEPSKGTGMGLAISQSIVHEHRGEITLESNPDGTRFFVTMPMVQSVSSMRTETGTSS